MTARQQGLVLIALLLCLSFVFQLQMKILANEIAPVFTKSDEELAGRLRALVGAAVAWRSLCIAILACSLFAVWLLALTRLELSFALPLASVALIVNALGAGILLDEAITPMRIAGVIAVAFGVALVLHT